jgi:8-oxo-dGTP diphosphatase
MFTLIDKLAWIYIIEKKILVTLSKGKDIWYIPGGKRESGESDIQALTREVKEELDVILDPKTISYYGTFEAQAHGKKEGTIVKMTCYFGIPIGVIKAQNEIAAYDYFSYLEINRTSPVDHLIFEDLKKKGLIF